MPLAMVMTALGASALVMVAIGRENRTAAGFKPAREVSPILIMLDRPPMSLVT
jgi:hypothetical protein